MDPDFIFFFLLIFILLVLTIVNLVGLIRKLWKSGIYTELKILATAILIVLFFIGIFKFDSVDSGQVYITTAQFIMLSACFFIALNWSINISKKLPSSILRGKPFIVIPVLTIIFSILLPLVFYWLANFFEHLDLMGGNE